MAKKTTKKTTKKPAAKTAKTVKASKQDVCTSNDAILKTIFIVLGVAVVIAAFYVGYLTGQGGSTIGASERNPVAGDGVLVITEYSDFECPFCQRFYNDAYQQIRSEYGDQVEIVYKHFPLSIHANAQKAAEASECARDQGMFWEYHDRLFEQGGLTVPELKAHATALGLNQAEFDNCLDSDEKASIVAEDMAEAQSRGASGTPSFWIDGELVVGAQPFSVFKQKIDAALSGSGTAGSGDTAPQPSAPQPSQPTAPEPTADVGDGTKPPLGDANAPVTIVEFLDYKCGFCGRHHEQTFPQIKENFVDEGLVKYVVRDFPVVGGNKAAEASRCAADQGMFWEYHDLLFSNQQASEAQYKAWAGELGLNQAEFDSCLDSGEKSSAVQADFSAGQEAGVTGTPGFFVNGVKINGAQPYDVFEDAINQALEN